ncbi:MAG: Na(+)-translocating NADH-quinone reductase subunit A [Paludibacteraceae bacterium]|nr:Na(+)-translocating NADH-quinone reductase subunit A [Paludibacteraceae bacterium]
MQQIILKRGLDIPVDGKAEKALGSVCRPEVYHIVPDHYAGVTPKLDVKEGAKVKAGSPLFHDKTFENLLFTSPVSGTVKAIVRGDRRKVLSIDILADARIEYEVLSDQVPSTKDEVKALLLRSGLWAVIKQRPYDCIALPTKEPRAIFISSFDSAPLAPDYEWVLQGQLATLQAAVSALNKVAPVYVGIRGGSRSTEFRELKDCTLYEVFGPHPAGNVGVQINHVLPMAKGDTMWTINIQDLALIGRLLTKGIVDMQKKVALTGPLAYGKQYYNVLPGMEYDSILRSNVHSEVTCRYIAGNVLTGKALESDKVTKDDVQGIPECISIYDNQLTVLSEGSEEHEFMGWLLPRFGSFHFGKTDPAAMLDCKLTRWLFGKPNYKWDARLKGGRRAIIVSGEYDKVFPMDIYPEYLIKAMIAGNLDKMEQLGANEVAPEDFALCEYVCTSKMPLQQIVRDALDNMRKEIE